VKKSGSITGAKIFEKLSQTPDQLLFNFFAQLYKISSEFVNFRVVQALKSVKGLLKLSIYFEN